MAIQAGTFNVQEFADAGAPLVSGRLYTYAYGTTTQKTAYTDAAGTIPHTYTSDGAGGQYIALNSRGELPAPLYLAAGSYDLALKRADGSSVWTRRADGTDTVQTGALTYLTSVAGTNTITASLAGLTAYAAGQEFRFIAAAANTGAVTLNISGLGAVAITKNGAGALAAGDIPASAMVGVRYDGTQFQITNLGVSAPAFSAYQSAAQSLPNNTATKIQFQTEEFDTGNAFDSTTNYRFQPVVPGYYMVTGALGISATTVNFLALTVYKNGASFKRGGQSKITSAGVESVAALVLLNGSTDYVELFGTQDSGGATNALTGADITYFQAVLVRPA